MVASASRGAFVCARCQLGASFRRELRSVTRVPLVSLYQVRSSSTQEDPPTNDNDGTVHPRRKTYYFREYGPNKPVGSKGRKQKPSTQPLKSKSLDDPAEVLVLKELPQRPRRKKPAKETEDKKDDEDAKGSALSAADIQKALEEKRLPNEDEVFAAIDQHRPDETLIDSDLLRQKCDALSNSHTTRQLRRYFKDRSRSQLSPERRKALRSSARSPRPSNALQELTITPWHAGSTPVTRELPRNSEELALVRSLANKNDIVDAIFRHLWKVDVADEQEQGQLEILLSETQWALLHTRDASELFSALRNKRFFQRSKFDRDAKRGALRMYGPRSECHSIATMMQTAFANASSTRIDIGVLQDTFGLDSPSDLDLKLSEKQLRDLMYLTRTSLKFDRKARVMEISGFKQPAVDDAVRLVTTTLRVPSRVIYTQTVFPARSGEATEMPMHVGSALPICARALPHSRSVTRIMKDSQHSARGETSRQGSERSVAVDVATEFAQKLSKRSKTKATLQAGSTGGPLWPSTVQYTPWSATFGILLKAVSDAAHEGADSSVPSFVPSTLGFTALLSRFTKLHPRADSGYKGTVGSFLVAKLIPSPYPESEASLVSLYPHLELVFRVIEGEAASQLGVSDFATPKSPFEHTGAMVFEVDDTIELALTDIKATFETEVHDMGMPDQSVDIRFTREAHLSGNIAEFAGDEELRGFLQSMVSSLQSGGEVRTPPYLTLPVPACRPRPGRKGKVLPKVRYMVTGLEHQEIKKITPAESKMHEPILRKEGFEWIVRDIEAGVRGGKRLEFAIQQGDGVLVSDLVRAAIAVSQFHSPDRSPLRWHPEQAEGTSKVKEMGERSVKGAASLDPQRTERSETYANTAGHERDEAKEGFDGHDKSSHGAAARFDSGPMADDLHAKDIRTRLQQLDDRLHVLGRPVEGLAADVERRSALYSFEH